MTRPYGIMLVGLALALCTAVEAKTAAERLADFEASFERTGEMENCLQLYRIQDTRVIDGRHILFRTDVSRYYVNTLPRACSSLSVHRSFVIRPQPTRLCNLDWITVYPTSLHFQ